jgi:hypothetical protein
MDYETILKGKYPAKDHAKRVADYIRTKLPNATGVLYVESRMTKLLEDNDEPEPFRYTPPEEAQILSTTMLTRLRLFSGNGVSSTTSREYHLPIAT